MHLQTVKLHSNYWLLWLRNDQTSTMKWNPGLQWWHHLVNIFQHSLPELIPVRAVSVLTVCSGEWCDIRVVGLFLGHFRPLSLSCEIPSWCQSCNGAGSDSASTRWPPQLSSLPPRRSVQAWPALQPHGKIISPITSHCITPQCSCWLSPQSPGGEVQSLLSHSFQKAVNNPTLVFSLFSSAQWTC